MASDHEKVVQNLLSFFENHAHQPMTGAYFSDLDNEGSVLSEKVYNVALSRLIYGLSYTSLAVSPQREKALRALDFQRRRLVAPDSLGGYFFSFFDPNEADTSATLDIWQQAYGLCGMTEYYRNYPDSALLSRIHKAHDGLVARFRDTKEGGFFGEYQLDKGQVSGTKTLQSLMYPITAYMENLWLADSVNRVRYEPIMREHLKLVYENAWNSELGWVNVVFDDHWSPCPHPSASSPCFMVTPGHNFQFATLLLRTQRWGFLSEEERSKYKLLGLEVLKTTLNKSIFSEAGTLKQGFFSEVNPVDNSVTDHRKTWWQHCEAIIALTLGGPTFQKERDQLVQFFVEHFPDYENGGEDFYIDPLNEPVTNVPKGSIGKSAYHTIEMIRFLEEGE